MLEYESERWGFKHIVMNKITPAQDLNKSQHVTYNTTVK